MTGHRSSRAHGTPYGHTHDPDTLSPVDRCATSRTPPPTSVPTDLTTTVQGSAAADSDKGPMRGSAREMGMATCGDSRSCLRTVGRMQCRVSVIVGLLCQHDHVPGLGVRHDAVFRPGRAVLRRGVGRILARPGHRPAAPCPKAVVVAGWAGSSSPGGSVPRVHPVQLSGNVDPDPGPVHRCHFHGVPCPDPGRGCCRVA